MQKVLLNEDEVKKALNINSFREISKDKVFELIEMSKDIDKETYSNIIEQVPHFISITKEFTQKASEIVEASKSLSKQTKEILSDVANNVDELLKKDNLDKEERVQLIELLNKIVDTLVKCDEDDKKHLNDILNKLLDFGKVVIGAMIIILGAKYVKGGKND